MKVLPRILRHPRLASTGKNSYVLLTTASGAVGERHRSINNDALHAHRRLQAEVIRLPKTSPAPQARRWTLFGLLHQVLPGNQDSTSNRHACEPARICRKDPKAPSQPCAAFSRAQGAA